MRKKLQLLFLLTIMFISCHEILAQQAQFAKPELVVQHCQPDISCQSLSLDSNYLATGSYDGSVVIWDLRSKKQITVLYHYYGIRIMKFCKNNFLVYGTMDRLLYVYNMINNKLWVIPFEDEKLPGQVEEIVTNDESNYCTIGISKFSGTTEVFPDYRRPLYIFNVDKEQLAKIETSLLGTKSIFIRNTNIFILYNLENEYFSFQNADEIFNIQNTDKHQINLPINKEIKFKFDEEIIHADYKFNAVNLYTKSKKIVYNIQTGEIETYKIDENQHKNIIKIQSSNSNLKIDIIKSLIKITKSNDKNDYYYLNDCKYDIYYGGVTTLNNISKFLKFENSYTLIVSDFFNNYQKIDLRNLSISKINKIPWNKGSTIKSHCYNYTAEYNEDGLVKIFENFSHKLICEFKNINKKIKYFDVNSNNFDVVYCLEDDSNLYYYNNISKKVYDFNIGFEEIYQTNFECYENDCLITVLSNKGIFILDPEKGVYWPLPDFADDYSNFRCTTAVNKPYLLIYPNMSPNRFLYVIDLKKDKNIFTYKSHPFDIHFQGFKAYFNNDASVVVLKGDYQIYLFNLRDSVKFNTLIRGIESLTAIEFLDNGSPIAGFKDGEIQFLDHPVMSKIKIPFNYGFIKDISNYNDELAILHGSGIITYGKLISIFKRDFLTTIKLFNHEYVINIGQDYELTNNNIFKLSPKYYTCSQGGYKAVAFRVGNRAYPFEQFDLQYNRPDIILERLGYASKEYIDTCRWAYQLRMNILKVDTTRFSSEFEIPELEVLNEHEVYQFDGDTLKLKVRAKAKRPEVPLDRFNIYVNEVPYFGMKGTSLNNALDTTFVVYVPLSSGRNKIQVSTFDVSNVESLRQIYEITNSKSKTMPDLHILTVGIENYSSNLLTKLNFTIDDCDTIHSIFQSQKGKLYKNIYSYRLTDIAATRKNIMDIKNKFMKSNVDDYVIVFLSGHGITKGHEFHFCTYGYDNKDNENESLSFEDIIELIDSIPARKKLVIIDACQSGEAYNLDSLLKIMNITDPKKIEELKLCLRIEEDKRGNKIAYKGNSFNLTDEKKITSKLREGDTLDKTLCEKLKQNINPFGVINKYQELFVDMNGSSGAIVLTSSSAFEPSAEDIKIKQGVFTQYFKMGFRAFLEDNSKNEMNAKDLMDYINSELKKKPDYKQKPEIKRGTIDVEFAIFKK